MVLSTMWLGSFCPLHMGSPEAQLRRFPMAGSRTPVQGRRICTIVCVGDQGASGGHSEPPKLEPFSQSRLNHAMRERSFLQKAEEALSDRCMALEGEDAWQCWEALFDFESIKKEVETECNIAQPGDRHACQPLERFENMVRQSGGVISLIDNVRMVAKVKETKKQKAAPDEEEWLKTVSAAGEEVDKPLEHESLEDGGLPKSAQELKEEIEALLPESQFSRFLKKIGHHRGT